MIVIEVVEDIQAVDYTVRDTCMLPAGTYTLTVEPHPFLAETQAGYVQDQQIGLAISAWRAEVARGTVVVKEGALPDGPAITIE